MIGRSVSIGFRNYLNMKFCKKLLIKIKVITYSYTATNIMTAVMSIENVISSLSNADALGKLNFSLSFKPKY